MTCLGLVDAMRSRLPPAHRIVWMCLENHAGDRSRCWSISVEAMMVELGLSLGTITRAIEGLVTEKIVRLERHKRRPTTYYMLRSYGQETAPEEPELTPQNESSTEHKGNSHTPKNESSSSELPLKNESLSAELTTHFEGSLTHQEESTSKSPPSETANCAEVPPEPPVACKDTTTRGRGRRKTLKHPLPEDWQPSMNSRLLGSSLGMAEARVDQEVAKMRRWASFNAVTGADWDARFDNWLEKAAETSPPQKPDCPRNRNGIDLSRMLGA